MIHLLPIFGAPVLPLQERVNRLPHHISVYLGRMDSVRASLTASEFVLLHMIFSLSLARGHKDCVILPHEFTDGVLRTDDPREAEGNWSASGVDLTMPTIRTAMARLLKYNIVARTPHGTLKRDGFVYEAVVLTYDWPGKTAARAA